MGRNSSWHAYPFPTSTQPSGIRQPPIERLNSQIKRRTDGIGILRTTTLSSAPSARCCSYRMMRRVQRARDMTQATVHPIADDPTICLPAMASRSSLPAPNITTTISTRSSTPPHGTASESAYLCLCWAARLIRISAAFAFATSRTAVSVLMSSVSPGPSRPAADCNAPS